MTQGQPADAMTDALDLSSAWLSALPEAFRLLVPGAGSPTLPPSPGGSDSAPIGSVERRVSGALEVLDGLLKQVYLGCVPWLAATPEVTAGSLQALAGAGNESIKGLLAMLQPAGDSLNASPWANLTQPVLPWASLLQALASGTLVEVPGGSQLRLGMERTFGGLADAFGLGPMRELDQVWRELQLASTAKQRAQVEYLALIAQAWNMGTHGLLAELIAIGERGERVESLLDFIRLWARTLDGPVHALMQDQRGLEVTAKVIRAGSHHRQQVQKFVGLASEALHVPTHADMDDAFREIQELKRELRRLRKERPPAAQEVLARGKEKE